MISSITKRFNIVRAKLLHDQHIALSTWDDVAHEMFKLYGRKKKAITRRMLMQRAGDMVQVEIDGRIIYWPADADHRRIVDMYFEVFEKGNNHYFDIPGMEVRNGDIVIDCGACEGYFTLKALESGAAKVLCVEPGEKITRYLKRTFKEEIDREKVIIHLGAVGVKNGYAVFSDNSADPTVGHMISNHEENVPNQCMNVVQMTTIDELCLVNSISKVDFIKADVEGGEVDLVHGAERIIREYRPNMAIAVYHAPENANLIAEFVDGLSLNYAICVKGIVDFDGVTRPVMLHAFRSKESIRDTSPS